MNVSLSQRYICELPSLSSARTHFITAQGPLETGSQQVFPSIIIRVRIYNGIGPLETSSQQLFSLTSPIEETVSKVRSTCKLKWHMVYSLILKQKKII